MALKNLGSSLWAPLLGPSKAGLMDAVRLFTCHFFGPGWQLAGTHSWLRAGRSVTVESCLAGRVPRGGAGGGTAGWMDGWTDGQWVGAGTHAPLKGHLSQQGLVARIEVRADSFWL